MEVGRQPRAIGLFEDDEEGFKILLLFLLIWLLGDLNEQKNEFDRYIESIAEDIGILEFWEKHENNYPKLSKLAKKILCVPASSASAERTFSRLRRIVTDQRFSLSSEKVEMLLIGSALKWFIVFASELITTYFYNKNFS